MTWWEHFLADAVPTAVMAVIVWSAVTATVVVAYLWGVRQGRRDAWQAVADMRAGFEQQIEQTVPMLSGQECDR